MLLEQLVARWDTVELLITNQCKCSHDTHAQMSHLNVRTIYIGLHCCFNVLCMCLGIRYHNCYGVYIV